MLRAPATACVRQKFKLVHSSWTCGRRHALLFHVQMYTRVRRVLPDNIKYTGSLGSSPSSWALPRYGRQHGMLATLAL